MVKQEHSMRILITGSMGYVGPILTRHLRQQFPDAELIGFDTAFFAHNLTGATRLPESLLDRTNYGEIREFPPELLDGVTSSFTSPPFLTIRWARNSKALPRRSTKKP